MADILLIRIQPDLFGALTELLEHKGHRVQICEGAQQITSRFNSREHSPDLAIIDVTVNDRESRMCLMQIKIIRARYGPRPALLCISKVYRGPQFELELERKGARIAYVR